LQSLNSVKLTGSVNLVLYYIKKLHKKYVYHKFPKDIDKVEKIDRRIDREIDTRIKHLD